MKKAANITNTSSISSSRFAEYFQANNNPCDNFFNEIYLNSEFQIMFEELNAEISHSEVQKAVKQLKNGASAGPDMFLNEFFKNGSVIMFNYLHDLFNRTFDLGYFPKQWSEGYIIPIYKKGNANEPSNYRGITLLSALGKLFTRILNNRLNEWAETYAIYMEAQAGFIKNISTVDNVITLNSLITHFLNQNNHLYRAFVDFTKAFDLVVRDNLRFKQIIVGVGGKILNKIQSMYTEVKSHVKHNNIVSQSFFSNIRVRQRKCLSPFLFVIYLNDLENEIDLKGADGIDIGNDQVIFITICRWHCVVCSHSC
ncbi:MAG: reverse transcriptase family protein [Candidatus Thiodiazotropha taylori]|nr:reverse transcriptase family protein [Candidatus Thiodiazotropha taylori]